jgi:DNA modification methylase
MVKLNFERNLKLKDQNSANLSGPTGLKTPEEIIYPIVVEDYKQDKDIIRWIKGDSLALNENRWLNKLILGENKSIMSQLLKDLKERIDLIYFDPPFFTHSNYYHKIFIGTQKKSVKSLAYQDRWENGLDSFLNFIYERIQLMKDLLSNQGSIYVHLDYRVSHYIKLLMDEVFGRENFRNEIIWHYPAASARTKRFYVRSYDSILFYTKSDEYIFNDDPQIYMAYSSRVKDALKKDEKGLYYYRGGSHDGIKLSQKVYVEKKGVFPPRDVWTNIPYIRANTPEYQGFSTQKPERLLKRIILASSNKDSIVADFFSGSGTTIAVAEKLKRKWIGVDLNWHSVHTTKKRLLDIAQSNDLYNWEDSYSQLPRPFEVINFKKNKQDRHILRDFISQNVQKRKNIIESGIGIKVKTNKKEDRIIVKVLNYESSFTNNLSKKLKKKILDWKDWIDYISVGIVQRDDIFIPIWYDYRTPKKREIELEKSIYINDPLIISHNLYLKIVDILGIETLKRIEIG